MPERFRRDEDSPDRRPGPATISLGRCPKTTIKKEGGGVLGAARVPEGRARPPSATA